MKTIVRELPNEIDQVMSSRTDLDKFILDIETYNYFLFHVYDKGLKNFIKIKDKKLYEIIRYDVNEYMDKFDDKPKAAYEYSSAVSRVNREYAMEYNRERIKFHEYQGFVYSFTYKGMMNTPNEIILKRYDCKDSALFLNRFLATINEEQGKSIWRRIKESLIK